MKILVTGGAGFIGSNFLNMFVPKYSNFMFINLDKLTYASNLLNVKKLERYSNYAFERGDITDINLLTKIFKKYQPEAVVHFAAESHVDRSILNPVEFIKTNIFGTFNLLETCRSFWKNKEGKFFHHISTDEVYGSLGKTSYFTENSRYNPSSPYSASKAAGDHLVRAYFKTYNLPVKISICANNYGPYQFPEKLIPLMILNALEGKPLPLYGTGKNVREWIFVEDHCTAIWTVLHKGKLGETYHIGGTKELTNYEMVHKICDLLANELGENPEKFKKLIKFIQDRPGHDLRYAIDASKIKKELNWVPRESLESGLKKTVNWYLNNHSWIENIKTGEYKKWMENNYASKIDTSL